MFSLGIADENMPTHIAHCEFNVFVQSSAEVSIINSSTNSKTFLVLPVLL